MKKWTLLALLAAVSAGSLLAEQFTGWITDRQCAIAGNYSGDHKKCLESGQPLVFVNENDKKMYVVSDPEKVKAYAGKKVSLTGKTSGDSIDTESVAEAK